MSATRRTLAPQRAALAWALLASAAAAASAQQTPDPHAGHVHPAPSAPAAPAAPAPRSTPADAAPVAPLPSFIRPLTDADRAAAFPPLARHAGHAVHDDAVHVYLLADELEWRSSGGRAGLHWDVDGWIGGDRERLWLRAEGVGDGGRLHEAHAHILYGRPISRWWDVVAGLRQDARPGQPQTWAAAGVQGFAPYRIDVELTGYVGAGGRTQLRADLAHDLRLARRIVAQTRLEATLDGKDDPSRDAGAGLAATELGVRVRYEIRRDLAPYLGVTWHRTYFGTADEARRHGEPTSTARLVLGLRVWR